MKQSDPRRSAGWRSGSGSHKWIEIIGMDPDRLAADSKVSLVVSKELQGVICFSDAEVILQLRNTIGTEHVEAGGPGQQCGVKPNRLQILELLEAMQTLQQGGPPFSDGGCLNQSLLVAATDFSSKSLPDPGPAWINLTASVNALCSTLSSVPVLSSKG
ncbi:hypothetical protein FIBSPDRAFT_899085 [Athelia psychrophila]|uniref:Uncharacterized protein n=1 Tax=Athelia psychrophila TaxID=1759441 RepID=A0A166A6I7_9AGAM|nr:hypothetical protein FIBSPDRAFT_899085 [Fibularhizoctonia sp. CBS 109695]